MAGRALGLHLRGCSAVGLGLRELGSKRLQLTESFGLPREGEIGCSTTLLSPLCTAVPCGKLEKPLSPQHRAPKAALPPRSAPGREQLERWDGMGWEA